MITEQQTSIVIVESQHLMRAALSTAISSEGMKVLAEIVDSRDVLEIASKLTPDLILFSVNHPSLRDLERISALRQGLSTTLIVALITGEFPGQFRLAQDYGAHLVLTKSIPRSELLSALKKLSQEEIDPTTVHID